MRKFIYSSISLTSYSFGMLAIVGMIVFLLGIDGIALSINSGESSSFAWLVNLLLVLVFAVQHTVMARASFKQALKRVLPAPLERSAYVFMSALCLTLLFHFWQPIEGSIWRVDSDAGRIALYGFYALGWGIVFASTFQIDHWHLFGLKQVYQWVKGHQPELERFVVPWMYRFVRHPMMTGMLILLWATPDMTFGRCYFAVMFTLYIVIGIRFEEKDLEKHFGEDYRVYQENVPALIPGAKLAANSEQLPQKY